MMRLKIPMWFLISDDVEVGIVKNNWMRVIFVFFRSCHTIRLN